MIDRMQRTVILLIIICTVTYSAAGISHAKVVGPTVYGQHDLGDVALQEFTYSMSVDCNAATINLTVLDERTRPVAGAQAYLRYIDYMTPLVSEGKTDQYGFILNQLPGKTEYMRGAFVLRIEKKGYRTKEVEFDISGCYTKGPWSPRPFSQLGNTTNGGGTRAGGGSGTSGTDTQGKTDGTSNTPGTANSTTQQQNATSNWPDDEYDHENNSWIEVGTRIGKMIWHDDRPTSSTVCTQPIGLLTLLLVILAVASSTGCTWRQQPAGTGSHPGARNDR